jgi:hypothetical protein
LAVKVFISTTYVVRLESPDSGSLRANNSLRHNYRQTPRHNLNFDGQWAAGIAVELVFGRLVAFDSNSLGSADSQIGPTSLAAEPRAGVVAQSGPKPAAGECANMTEAVSGGRLGHEVQVECVPRDVHELNEAGSFDRR